MPPKQKISTGIATRASMAKRQRGSIIQIYKMLTQPEMLYPMYKLADQFKQLINNDLGLFKKNVFVFLVSCCEFKRLSLLANINEQEYEKVLRETLKTNQENENYEHCPLIINKKHLSHKIFIQNLRELFKLLVINNTMAFGQKIEFYDQILKWIKILITSKRSVIRNCSFQVLKYIIQSELEQLNSLKYKQQKKAQTISNHISSIFIQILSKGILDDDSEIMKTSLGLTKIIFIKNQSQLLNVNALKNLFDTSFNQESLILQNVLQLILELLQDTRNNNLRQMLEYSFGHMKDLEKFSIKANNIGFYSFKILIKINQIDPQMQSLRLFNIANVFSNFSKKNFLKGLPLAVKAFVKKICPQKQKIQMESEEILKSLIMLLLVINNQKQIKTILRQFFVSQNINVSSIFQFQGMINFVTSQQLYVNSYSQEIIRRKNQLNMMAQIIIEYVEFLQKKVKQQNGPQKILLLKKLQSYNINLLALSQYLFNNKIVVKQYQEIMHSLLKMFSRIHLPLAKSLQTHKSFIIQVVGNMFEVDFQNLQAYRQIINIYSKYQFPASHIQKLDKTLQLNEFNNFIGKHNILRISAILSKYRRQILLSPNVLNHLIDTYNQWNNLGISIKLQLIDISRLFIESIFKNLCQSQRPKSSNVNFYKVSCQRIVQFLAHILKLDQDIKIKFSCFQTLLKIIQLVCNQEILQAHSDLQFYLDQQPMRIIYNFVDQFSDYKQDFQIKKDIQKSLFATYMSSFCFVMHKLSVKFILCLLQDLQARQEIFNQNLQNDQFVFKTISKKYIQELLTKYVCEEPYDNSKTIFWGLCGKLIYLSYQSPEHNLIIYKIIGIYFKYRQNASALTQENLLNKFILFLKTIVQKLIQKGQYKKLDICQNILYNCFKKCQKSALLQLKQFVDHLIQSRNINSPYMHDFAEYLTHICRHEGPQK